ncbi:MAG: UDP-N-acetylmuramate--L-alanine ligase [Ilumatobacter sp.]|nr:MAG: UDP-N-acetylmuramate--L-alanine ligase [Ilumatobacter sp.]
MSTPIPSTLAPGPDTPSTRPSAVGPDGPLDLGHRRRLHIVGVGGPGMSAIAIALAQMGHVVSGSDLRERPILDRLRAAGVSVHIGHRRSHVLGCDAVTASTAIPANNNELDEARKLGVPTLSRAAMLASICARARSLAVAGTHGKTTTTSMLMLVLAEAGMRPSFVIGGDVTDMGTGAQWTGGDWFVVEADESDGTHLELPLFGTILTNIDHDHLDHYGSFDGVIASFDQYLGQVRGPRVVCGDDEIAAELAGRHGATTYGLGPDVDVRAVDLHADSGSFRFGVEIAGDRVVEVLLPLRGVHNVLNATGVIAMASSIGIDPEVAATALSKFGGVARRFDIRGVDRGATFVDDYAHLPGEIAAVLAAARHSGDGWERVVAVFQPNRYNRIAEMWAEYHSAFVDADVVVLTDVYPSGTTPIPGVTGKLIVNTVLDHHPATRVVWLPQRDDLVAFIAREVRSGDVCISMGCGDIATLPDEVLVARRGGASIGVPAP